MPGHEKVTSISSAPPIREATVMPAMVSTGSSALGSPCRSTTRDSISPRLRADSM